MDGTALGCNSKFAKSGLLPLHEQLKMFPGSSFTKGIYFDQRLVVGPVEIRQAILELHADFTDLSSRKKVNGVELRDWLCVGGFRAVHVSLFFFFVGF